MTLVEHQAQAEKDQRQGLPFMLRKAITMAEPGILGVCNCGFGMGGRL